MEGRPNALMLTVKKRTFALKSASLFFIWAERKRTSWGSEVSVPDERNVIFSCIFKWGFKFDIQSAVIKLACMFLQRLFSPHVQMFRVVTFSFQEPVILDNSPAKWKTQVKMLLNHSKNIFLDGEDGFISWYTVWLTDHFPVLCFSF